MVTLQALARGIAIGCFRGTVQTICLVVIECTVASTVVYVRPFRNVLRLLLELLSSFCRLTVTLLLLTMNVGFGSLQEIHQISRTMYFINTSLALLMVVITSYTTYHTSKRHFLPHCELIHGLPQLFQSR